MDAERWLPVVGWEDRYEVSDLGRVRGIRRQGTKGGLIKTTVDPRGYVRVGLWRPLTRRFNRFVHQLVLEAFVGPRPEGLQTRHLNDVKTDNALTNLCWGTPSENGYDQVRNGVHGSFTIRPRANR